MRRLSLAMTGSLHNSIHPPEMNINPSKTVCGCPSGWVRERSLTQSFHSMGYSCRCAIAHTARPPQFKLGKATAAKTTGENNLRSERKGKYGASHRRFSTSLSQFQSESDAGHRDKFKLATDSSASIRVRFRSQRQVGISYTDSSASV